MSTAVPTVAPTVASPYWVIYDSECNFCRRSIALLQKLDTQHRLAYLSSHDPTLASRFPDIRRDNTKSEMLVITPDNMHHGGAEACRVLAGILPGWGWATWFYYLPGFAWLAREVYAWISRNRHRLLR